MSRCSKKCNELKELLDSISGLNDSYIYKELCDIETKIELIQEYADMDIYNGTCFRKPTTPKLAEEQDSLDILEYTDISSIDDAENIDLRTYQLAVKNVLNMYNREKKIAQGLLQDDINQILYRVNGSDDLAKLLAELPPIVINRIANALVSEYISYKDIDGFVHSSDSNKTKYRGLHKKLEKYVCDKSLL